MQPYQCVFGRFAATISLSGVGVVDIHFVEDAVTRRAGGGEGRGKPAAVDGQSEALAEIHIGKHLRAPLGKGFGIGVEGQLGGVGLCDILNLAEPTASYSTVDPSFDTSGIAASLTTLGFPIGDAVKNQTKVEFSITQFLSLLSFTGAGEHSFEMTITDNDGNVTVKTLMITTL